MKRLAYLTRTGPAFTISPEHAKASTRQVRIRRVTTKQPIVFKVRLPTHADQGTWNKFVARAQTDGVTLGDLFRSLIYGYAEGKDSLKLPPSSPEKK